MRHWGEEMGRGGIWKERVVMDALMMDTDDGKRVRGGEAKI